VMWLLVMLGVLDRGEYSIVTTWSGLKVLTHSSWTQSISLISCI
jgi:hypothetical protein